LLQNARRFADRGGGVIMVLHDLDLAVGAADKIVVMREGAIVEHVAAQALSPQMIECVFGVRPDWKLRGCA
jgi:ABC-type hemin transport system ATPase subunit